jgi:hypothetical protein
VGQALAGQLAGPGQELDRPARARLGPAPLRALLVEVARPLATRKTKGAWYRGWRLVALDGTTLDVPDTPANVAAFGRPGGGRGQGAVLQVRLVGLVECGTHAVVDAAMGGLHLGEGSLAPSLGRSLGPGMLLLVDQGLCGLELWRTFHATGAELVWRCRQDVTLEVLEVLADGSWAQLDLRRQFDAQGLKPGMKVKLILTK